MAHILLADDDSGAREIVRRAIELDGHTVTVADDGSEALAKLSYARPVDVLVTDVEMPGLDGISLAKKVLELAPSTLIIMMSAYPNALENARLVRAPAMRVVTKPFTVDRIRSEIRAILRK